MKEHENFAKAYDGAVPQEFAGALNLLAHPLAGAAATGALGLGMVSHAFGMWMGTLAGMAEISRRMLGEPSETAQNPSEKPAARLKLVSSRKVSLGFSDKISAAETSPAPVTAKLVQPKAAARPAAPDDLKAITGVGPKLEKVLNDLGIWSHAQIAGLSAAEVAWLDDHLGFSGRIGRDDWIGQARALSGTR